MLSVACTTVEEDVANFVKTVGHLGFVIDIAKEKLEFFGRLREYFASFNTIKITIENVEEYKDHMSGIFKYYSRHNTWPSHDWNCEKENNSRNKHTHGMKTGTDGGESVDNNNDERQIVNELLWRIHLLHPDTYRNDCKNSFGIVIPFILDKTGSNISHGKNDIDLQFGDDDTHAGHDIEGHVQANVNSNDGAFEEGENENSINFDINVDLIDAFESEKDYIISITDQFDQLNFFDNQKNNLFKLCLKRYYLFLYLSKKFWRIGKLGYNVSVKEKLARNTISSGILMPRLDIDLIWHSHLLVPYHYHEINDKLFGANYMLNHEYHRESSQTEYQTKEYWNYIFQEFITNKGFEYTYTGDAFKCYTFKSMMDERDVQTQLISLGDYDTTNMDPDPDPDPSCPAVELAEAKVNQSGVNKKQNKDGGIRMQSMSVEQAQQDVQDVRDVHGNKHRKKQILQRATSCCFVCSLLLSFGMFVGISIILDMLLDSNYEIKDYDTTILINENLDLHVKMYFKNRISSYLLRSGWKSVGLMDFTYNNLSANVLNNNNDVKMSFSEIKKLGNDSTNSYVKYTYDSPFSFVDFPYIYQFEISYLIKNDINDTNDTNSAKSAFCYYSSNNETIDSSVLFLSWFNQFENLDLVGSSQLTIYCHNNLYDMNNSKTMQVSSNYNQYSTNTVSAIKVNSSISNYTQCFHLSNAIETLINSAFNLRSNFYIAFENINLGSWDGKNSYVCNDDSTKNGGYYTTQAKTWWTSNRITVNVIGIFVYMLTICCCVLAVSQKC